MRLLPVLFLAATILVSSACQQQESSPPPPPLTIGFLGQMEDGEGGWGKNGLYGCQLVLELTPTLANGTPVQVLSATIGDQPEEAIEALELMAQKEQVAAVMLMSDSRIALELAKAADELALPLLALTASHPDVASGRYTSQLMVNDSIQGTVAALYILDELLIEQVVVYKDLTSTHSRFLTDTFVATFTAAGGICKVVEFSGDEDNLIQLLDSQHTQPAAMIYAPVDTAHLLTIVRRTRDWPKPPLIMARDTLLSELVLQHPDRLGDVEGIITPDVFAATEQRTPFGEKLYRLHRQRLTQTGTTLAVLGAEGLAILMAAADRCQGVSDRQCINAALRSTHDFMGYCGKISIGSDGHAERAVFLNTIREKQLVFLVKVH